MKHAYALPIAGTLLLVSACGEKRTAAPAQQNSASSPATVLFGGASATIPTAACRDENGTAVQKSKNKIKFKIKSNFLKDFGGNGQTIPRDVVTDVNGNDVPQPSPPSDIAKKYWPTYLDIGIDEPDGMTKWTQVVVKVKPDASNGIQFMKVRDANGNFDPKDSSVAVMAEASKVAKFCYRQPIELDADGDETIKFGVMLAKGETVSINIGVLVEDKTNKGFWIPIYIDPNMKNTG